MKKSDKLNTMAADSNPDVDDVDSMDGVDEDIDDAGVGVVDDDDYELTDEGSSRRFAGMFKDDVRFSIENKVWYVWTSLGWSDRNAHYQIRQLLHDIACDWGREGYALINAASKTPDENKAKILRAKGKAMMSHSRSLGFVGRINAVLSLVAEDPNIALSVSDLDSRGELLGVANGVIELYRERMVKGLPTPVQAGAQQWWKFRKPEREDLTTQRCAAKYSKEPKRKMWDRLVTAALPTDEVRWYFQKLAGTALLDDNPVRAWVFLRGGTGTGKTTILEILAETLGVEGSGYAGGFELNMMREKREGGPNPALVRLLKKRFIYSSETADADSGELALDAAVVKRMTGRDRLEGVLKYSNETVSRIPAFTPFTATNDAPKIPGADRATYRRLHPVPFEVEQPMGDEIGKYRNGIIANELDGVLAWLLEGMAGFFKEGAEMPGKMLEFKADFDDDVNAFRRDLAEICDFDPSYMATSSDLLTAWLGRVGATAYKAAGFGRKLTAAQFLQVRGTRRPIGDKTKQRPRMGLKLNKYGEELFQFSPENRTMRSSSYQFKEDS